MTKDQQNILIIASLVLLVSLIVWVNVDIQNKINAPTQNTIIVSETAEVWAKPDLALTTFSVVTEAKTVGEALSENTGKMNKIINFLKEEKMADKDLKTTSFNLYPRYEWYEEGERRVLVGYEVRQSLEVKIRDLEKIGQLVEGATIAGANQVGDLQFTIENEEELKKQAREEAIKKAKTKAKELASQLGVNLGRMTNFSESGEIPYYYSLEKAVSFGGEVPQIEIGENKISITVSLTYEIN